MSCQTGIEASQELREFLGGCRGGCTRCVKVLKLVQLVVEFLVELLVEFLVMFLVILKFLVMVAMFRCQLWNKETGHSWSWTLTR